MSQPTETTDRRTDPRPSDGDHDRFAHIVARDDEMRGYVMGEEIKALCGKRFVPTRDPSRFQVCPACRAVLEAMP